MGHDCVKWQSGQGVRQGKSDWLQEGEGLASRDDYEDLHLIDKNIRDKKRRQARERGECKLMVQQGMHGDSSL